MPDVGRPAPDFALLDHRGEQVALKDFRGRTVVLFAFPRANTGGCNAQALGFNERLDDLARLGAVVVGMSPDSPEKLARWRQGKDLRFDLLSDPEHRVIEMYGAWGEKKLYGKTYHGVIRSHWIIGPDGTLLDQQIKVSPRISVERAVRFLEEHRS